MDLTTVDKLLTTTRSVRKRLDLNRPVEPEVIEACLNIAIQAPTGSNAQGWHFLVVTDPAIKTQIGALYRESFKIYAHTRNEQAPRAGNAKISQEQQMRVTKSAAYLSKHMGEVPVLVIPCIRGRVETLGPMAQAGLYGSILPAAWSFMLALRARGLGTAWTTLHLRYEKEIAALLGIPDNVTQAALLPVAYFTGEDFRPARRIPAPKVTSWNQWGQAG